jgi:hypothetical protein
LVEIKENDQQEVLFKFDTSHLKEF